MTKLSLLGILMIAAGLAVVTFWPRTSTCVTDGDFTMCETSASAVISGIGLVLIAIGCAAAALGLRRREDHTS